MTIETRKETHSKITAAVHAWNNAPVHVRAMAASFVLPIIAAFGAINNELAELQNKKGKDDQDHGSQT